uniref:anthocyanidin 3-O-glucosyltransferase 2-like n=1 Tax=Erigeron canadensis TaxID=72917 RepID=UPI001CB90C20|nr:anthocyanidin 3-O-glucosyltransferase 2-like [Erigeron canadensis]
MDNTPAKLVFIPNPAHGHIMSTVQIAKLLVDRDQHLSITVLVIKFPSFGSHTPTTTYIDSLAKNNTTSRISFIELPQNEFPPLDDSKSSYSFFGDFIDSHCNYVRNVVADIVTQPGSGRLAGFVIDMFFTSMIDIANEFNVPSYVFYTTNASFLGFMFYIQLLDQSQNVVELSNSNTEVSVPSYAKPVPTRVFWDIVQTREGMDYILTIIRKLREVKGIMVNTFLELETHAFKSLADDISTPPVYPVGPILNLESVAKQPSDDDIIRWLDSQPPSSVVFLCFGSMGSFDEIQVKEIARALEQSGHRFVWCLRQPPSDQISKLPGNYEDPGTVLPKGFLERTHGIGKVMGWAPQVEVLAHIAVGGFVSHCGWNSLLESLWFGVPIATWPVYAEQQMNAFKMVVEMGLAVDIKLDYRKDVLNVKANTVTVTAEEIESGIRRVMEDTEVRTKVKDMSDKSRRVLAEGGSSYASVGRFIQDVRGNISSF